MVAISGSVLSKEAADTQEKLNGLNSKTAQSCNYIKEIEHPNLSTGAAATKHSP